MIRKNQLHRFHYQKDTKGFLLFFKEEFLNSYLNEIEIAKIIQIFNEFITSPKTQCKKEDFAELNLLFEGIYNEYKNINDAYSLQIIRSLLHVVTSLIYRAKSKTFSKLEHKKNLREFIKFQHILEKNYQISKKVKFYADAMGFSSKKLNTIIQFITSKTAKDFIDDVVIIKIKKELLYTNLSIKEVAFKTGFKDTTNFFKYFKTRTNYTPKEYRKLNFS